MPTPPPNTERDPRDVVAIINTSPDTIDLLKDVFERAGLLVASTFTHDIRDAKVDLATAPTVFPSSRTSRTAPSLNSSENCRRRRRPPLLAAMRDIVSTFRNVSTKPDQAHGDGCPSSSSLHSPVTARRT
jgi:hypothetical protein